MEPGRNSPEPSSNQQGWTGEAADGPLGRLRSGCAELLGSLPLTAAGRPSAPAAWPEHPSARPFGAVRLEGGGVSLA
eukprot:CAMPEP_0175611074 /NCGR_PEP_ID=MMETSP0096-20121207/63114_1 /TAXON_ID=311494 /ORGANISM="Alexandrium monilatum, Strain CCMP3105" /LENGTH=76 /DNA_ID=CAMNT_0016916065 /DNA_START=40 /DNA_END=267 /DNA_ORIENTATION=-